MTAVADSVAQFIADAGLARQIIQGPSTGAGSTVTTLNGPVPSFAKAIADFQSSTLLRFPFTTTGAATVTLPWTPSGASQLYISGVYQNSGTYAIASNVLTFTEAPPAGLDCEVIALTAAAVATVNAQNVVYDGAKTGQDVMDAAVPIADYTELRAYTGRAKTVRITGIVGSSIPSGIAGVFTRTDLDTTSADNGGTIIVDASSRRWKRIFNGSVDVRWFGAKGDGTTDDTAAFAAVIAASKNVYVPAGSYVLSSLQLAYGLRLVGAGRQNTTILSKTATGVANFVTIPIGPIQYLSIEGITFTGAAAGNPNQNGWYFQAQASAGTPFNGGLWNSVFKDCTISGFDKHQIVLRGGGTGFLLPHQFIRFDGVETYRPNNSTSRALLMTGQVQHVSFVNCEFDGQTIGTGTNIEISREFSNAGAYGGSTIGGTAVGDNAPSANSFFVCTSQSANLAIDVDRASSITWFGSYFEAVTNVINNHTSAYGQLLSGCYYTNCAPTGSGGTLFTNGSVSTLQVMGGKITGSINRLVADTNSVGLDVRAMSLNESVSSGDSSSPAMTIGMTKQVSVISNAITISDTSRTVIVNADAAAIKNIKSLALPGESLYLKAHGGTINFDNTGNINLGSATTLTLASGEVAQFVRFDLGGTWMLVK